MLTKRRKVFTGLALSVAVFVSVLSFGGVYKAAAKQGVVTLTIRGTDAGPIPGIQNNEVAKEIEKSLGIKLKWITSDPNKDKVALASGDLPDIVQIMSGDFGTYIKGGHVISLEKYMSTYGKDITKNSSKMLSFSRKYLSAGTNKLYGITCNNVYNRTKQAPTYAYQHGFILPWHYYKELGYPAVKNADDYLNVLAQMQKAHPETKDGKKVYGISGWNDWGTWAYFVPYTFAQGYLNGPQSCTTADGNIIPFFTNEKNNPYKDAMKFLYKANKMGLLDPEAFTQKNENFVSKFTNQEILSPPTTWWNSDAIKNAQSQGIQDAGWYVIPGSSPAVFKGYGSIAGDTSRALFITKRCKYPEKAMQLINFFFTADGNRLMRSGIKDKQWTIQNGKAEYTDATLKAMKNEQQYAQRTGSASLYNNLCGFTGDSVNPADKTVFDLGQTKKAIAANTTAADKDFCQYYKVSYPGEVFENLAEQKKLKITYFDITWGSVEPDMPSDLKMVDAKVNIEVPTLIANLVYAKDDNDFEQIWTDGVKKLNSLGIDKYYKWQLEENKKGNAIVKSLK